MRLRRLFVAGFAVVSVLGCSNQVAAPNTGGRSSDASRPDTTVIAAEPTTNAAPASASTSTTTSTSTSTAAPTTTNLPAGDPRFAVASFWEEYTDTARNRTMKTRVHYPARGTPGTVGS